MKIRKDFEKFRRLTNAKFQIVQSTFENVRESFKQTDFRLLETLEALDDWQNSVNETLDYFVDELDNDDDRINKIEKRLDKLENK